MSEHAYDPKTLGCICGTTKAVMIRFGVAKPIAVEMHSSGLSLQTIAYNHGDTRALTRWMLRERDNKYIAPDEMVILEDGDVFDFIPPASFNR